jgi:hypothetical protein
MVRLKVWFIHARNIYVCASRSNCTDLLYIYIYIYIYISTQKQTTWYEFTLQAAHWRTFHTVKLSNSHGQLSLDLCFPMTLVRHGFYRVTLPQKHGHSCVGIHRNAYVWYLCMFWQNSCLRHLYLFRSFKSIQMLEYIYIYIYIYKHTQTHIHMYIFVRLVLITTLIQNESREGVRCMCAHSVSMCAASSSFWFDKSHPMAWLFVSIWVCLSHCLESIRLTTCVCVYVHRTHVYTWVTLTHTCASLSLSSFFWSKSTSDNRICSPSASLPPVCCMYVFIYVCTCVCACMFVNGHICALSNINKFVFMYINTFVCMYASMYIYAHDLNGVAFITLARAHTHTDTHTQTHAHETLMQLRQALSANIRYKHQIHRCTHTCAHVKCSDQTWMALTASSATGRSHSNALEHTSAASELSFQPVCSIRTLKKILRYFPVLIDESARRLWVSEWECIYIYIYIYMYIYICIHTHTHAHT